MNGKIHNSKWDKEKIDTVVEILKDHIISRRGVLGISFPDGTGKVGITDPGEITISESMVGGSVYNCELIEISSKENIKYLVYIDESLYSYFWATIIRYINGVHDSEESYATYEETLRAVKDLARGKRPFDFVRCFTDKQMCCYCRFWDGDRRIDSSKKLWADPDVRGKCCNNAVEVLHKKYLPNNRACPYFDPLNLEKVWIEANMEMND